MCIKYLAGLILFLGLNAFAIADYPGSPKGLKYMSDWAGEYEVTQCIRCEDMLLDNGANLKNFKWFGIRFSRISESNLPACAMTDHNIEFAFKFASDDGTFEHFPHVTFGLCDWRLAGKQTKFLTISPDFFHYQSDFFGRQQTIMIEKTGVDTVRMYRRVINEKHRV